MATARAAENRGFPRRSAEAGINLNAMVRELEGRMINEALRADRRQQAGRGAAAGAQADDLFSQAAALRRDCAGSAQAGAMSREAMTAMMEQSDRLPQIMVVDDDPDTVSILARHLQREGFVAIEAVSGAECIRLVARESG